MILSYSGETDAVEAQNDLVYAESGIAQQCLTKKALKRRARKEIDRGDTTHHHRSAEKRFPALWRPGVFIASSGKENPK